MSDYVYIIPGLPGTYDTRHAAVGALARYEENATRSRVVPIAEDCLVRPLYSVEVGPIHLGDKHYDDRGKLATTHGAVDLDCITLVQFKNDTRGKTVDGHWESTCPDCGRHIQVDGYDEAARSDLITQVLDCCPDVDWMPPADYVEDCEICGADHRGEYECRAPAYRTPFPGVDHDYACHECPWDGPGDSLDAPEGRCPNCNSTAVEAEAA